MKLKMFNETSIDRFQEFKTQLNFICYIPFFHWHYRFERINTVFAEFHYAFHKQAVIKTGNKIPFHFPLYDKIQNKPARG
jgi:hypothetical protein